MSLFDIADLSPAEIIEILDRAEAYAGKRTDELAEKTVATLFFENSTRTRLSFELAATRLGSEVVSFTPESSSAAKGESLRDTIQTVGALGVDLLIIRHRNVGVAEMANRWTGLPVINAGDGRRAHPTQTLLDLLTMRRRFGTVAGLSVAIVGDIANSRVARGMLDALPRLGSRVTLVGPSTFLPEPSPWSASVSRDLDSVVAGADVVYMLRVQKERGATAAYPSDASYSRRFGLTEERASLMKPGAVVMHPGPINRGVEIASSVADGERSLILDQVRNGVPVRMAVMASEVGERH